MNSTDSRVVLLLVSASVAVLFLPSVSAGHFCKKCQSNPLQSPTACNMSSPEENCWKKKPCYAVTAELMNGTLVSTRGCYDSQGSCDSTTACEQVKNQTDTAFKHCIAKCCETERCNTIVPGPAFTSTPTPSLSSSGPVTASSSIGGTTAPEIPTPPGPTSSTMKKGLHHLLVLFLTVIFILN